MKRSNSRLAQIAFDTSQNLRSQTARSSRLLRLFARVTAKLYLPIAQRITANHTVVAQVYGHRMTMPAEHYLPIILLSLPQYNRPLALAIEAIANLRSDSLPLVVVDVGANIGDTIAIVEQRAPGICFYLCIEPDQEMAEMCIANHSDNDRVTVKQCFIGENEGAVVTLEDDGRANPSTKTAEPGSEGKIQGSLLRLDTVAMPFAEKYGRVSLIKVDTEGYDFSVLRSGSELLKKYEPSLYFEWYPKLLNGLNEDPTAGFEYLQQLGYQHFAIFTNQGDFYCKISNPDRLFLRSLASITLQKDDLPYFDIFASTSSLICDELVELSTSRLR